MSKTVKDLLVSVSLASLCFLSGWRVLLNPLHYTYFHWKYYPGFIEYAALVINVLILAALFWGAMTLVRRSGKPQLVQAARWVFLLLLVVPINSLRLQFFDPLISAGTNRLGYAVFLLPFTVIIFLAVVVKRWRSQIFRAASLVVLVLFPFFVIALFQGAWLTFKYRGHAELASRELHAPALNSTRQDAPRVLWIVFDELDQRVAFAERPQGLELKEFDRLRGESLFALNAYAPASVTLFSMPSLIVGRKISGALPQNPAELTVTLADGNQQVEWSKQPNVFAAARARGFDTALVGWYHPYCRVIGSSLTSCYWQPVVDAISPLRGEPTLLKSMYYWTETALFTVPGMFRLLKSRYERERSDAHAEEHLRILERAKAVVRKREFGLTLLHFPIPHHPFIYDREGGALSTNPESTYEDNLVLTDRTLGEIRREMESAGLWDVTTVIVSSDHYWRLNPKGTHDQPVPFILKLPGQKQGLTYDPKFNTVVSYQLIHSILKGELTDPDSVVKWLDHNPSTVTTAGAPQ